MQVLQAAPAQRGLLSETTTRFQALCICLSVACGVPAGGVCRRVLPAPAHGTFCSMGPKRKAGTETSHAKRQKKGEQGKAASAVVGRQGFGIAPKSGPPGPIRAPAWFEEMYQGAMSEEYKRYMNEEWGHEKRGDVALFEKLSLEGAQAGLSWATILAKRNGYREAFYNFDIRRCAKMSPDDIESLLKSSKASVVRHRGKCQSVATNAQCVVKLMEEEAAADMRAGKSKPEHGYFDRYIWSFVGGSPVLNSWTSAKAIPTETECAVAMSKDMKRRGFKFVGPKICYSLMQSCG